VVVVIIGHLLGLLVPGSWTAAVGITDAVYHLISVTAGTLAGAMMLAGLVLLVARRILLRLGTPNHHCHRRRDVCGARDRCACSASGRRSG